MGDDARDVTATEVLGNIEAMRWATDTLATAPTIDVDGICEIHRRLLTGTRHEHIAGIIRAEQNWIGGSSYNPCSAAFVPPPPEVVCKLSAICASSSVATISRQSSKPHWCTPSSRPSIPLPMKRSTGPALIHVVLRRRGLVDRAAPPISLIWERRRRSTSRG